MNYAVLIACLLLAGCASLEQQAQHVSAAEAEPEKLIIVELPADELLKTCGLWSGTGGCVWMNHKFILKTGLDV